MRSAALTIVSLWAAWSSGAAFPADEAFEKKARPEGAFQLLDGDRVHLQSGAIVEHLAVFVAPGRIEERISISVS